MTTKSFFSALSVAAGLTLLSALPAQAQIGTRFPSEKKVVQDPVTGVDLIFLTSTSAGDSKIYQTHRQWTADGKWVIFRSSRVRGEAMAVNEETGEMVQVSEGGYAGMLCVADTSMNLYFLRTPQLPTPPQAEGAPAVRPEPEQAAQAPADGNGVQGGRGGRRGRGGRGGGGGPRGPAQLVKVDLALLFADSAAGTLKPADAYQKVLGTIPPEMGGGGDLAIDTTEEYGYFRVSREYAAERLPADQKAEVNFGPRNMGSGPGGLAKMNLKTGECSFICAVPFQIGHVQANSWMPGEIVFCWETGGKSPQRTWTVMADGTGLRPLYKEADYEWITHEAIISKDEVAIAILSHRPIRPDTESVDGPGQEPGWGNAGTSEHPTGVGIVNLRTRQIDLVGQVPLNDGRSNWHVHGSPDGRWAVADDFQYRLWLFDRKDGQRVLLADLGHKRTAQDHIHPTFNADSKRIEVQTAMLAEDGRALNICVINVPDSWLNKTYPPKVAE